MKSTVKSETLFKEAVQHLVGGVNSPVRAFKAVGGAPLFIKKADGATIEDVDGNTYIDFVGSWGPHILGHNAAPVVKAAREAIANGTSFGAPCETEIRLASLIKEAMPSIELMRMTSSGTEATMSAVRVARAHTKRVRIVKFEGGYHGHSDGMLVAAGSGATTFGVPSSAGIPDFLAKNTWVLPYNDVSSFENLMQKQGINVAAVIVEPVCGNMGVVIPTNEFIQSLVTLTKKYGALLIFDEVMTGFRLGWGGAQGLFGIKPDLTCLGKIIGGGFPVGAFGGRRDIMEKVAPLGPVYQAGTLSGNPVAMAAGFAALSELKKTQPYDDLNKIAMDLVASIKASAKKKKISVEVNQLGSMFTVFFTDQPVNSYFSAMNSDTRKFGRFFQALLAAGIYMPPSQFEAAFLSTAHTPDVMKNAKQAFADAFAALE